MGKKLLVKNAKAIVTCDAKDSVLYGQDMLVDGQEIGRIELFYAASVEEDGASRLNTWEKIRRAWALAEKYGGNPLIYYTD